ncbi:MAG TPA: proton-conducting transporter membrane subunit, partial [Casimicrobiaceae bacterium]|nr:proton-conducting transporter membrane subunit [Casimicrobiaceae bacterium]
MSWQTVLTAMAPEHLLLLGIVLLVLAPLAGIKGGAATTLALTAVLAAAIAAAALHVAGYDVAAFQGHFSVSPASSLAKAIVLALAIPVVLMSRDDFADGPFAILLLSSLYGFCLLLSSESFLTLFLGLELMSLPVYALVLLAFTRTQSTEAALKYLILGGTASALFLMGVTLLYGGTNSMSIGAFTSALMTGDLQATSAIVLITIAFFLKAAIVPFHAWAPDAYEGASVPVTAYMATVIKAGVLLAAVRLFDVVTLTGPAVDLVAILPLVSIVWGNLAAMRQTS